MSGCSMATVIQDELLMIFHKVALDSCKAFTINNYHKNTKLYQKTSYSLLYLMTLTLQLGIPLNNGGRSKAIVDSETQPIFYVIPYYDKQQCFLYSILPEFFVLDVPFLILIQFDALDPDSLLCI